MYNVYISSWERAVPIGNGPHPICPVRAVLDGTWNVDCRSQSTGTGRTWVNAVLTADRSGWPRIAVNGSSYLSAGRTQWERVVLSIEWSASLREVIWDWLRTALVENGSFPVKSEVVRGRAQSWQLSDWVRVAASGNGSFPKAAEHNLFSFLPPV